MAGGNTARSSFFLFVLAGQTALHWAALNGDAKAMALLLEHRAPLDPVRAAFRYTCPLLRMDRAEGWGEPGKMTVWIPG